MQGLDTERILRQGIFHEQNHHLKPLSAPMQPRAFFLNSFKTLEVPALVSLAPMKTRHFAFDRIPLSENRQRDTNGFLINRARIFRPGVVTYLRGDFELPGDPNERIKVARLPEDVLSPATVKSFEGLDVLVGHAMQGRDRKSRERADGNVAGAIDISDGTLITDLMIKSEDAEKALEKGVKEISPGFLFVLIEESGVFEGEAYEYRQVEIRGNHVAVVPRGRSGPEVRVFDEQISHPQTTEEGMDQKEKDSLFGEFLAKLGISVGQDKAVAAPPATPAAQPAANDAAGNDRLAAALEGIGSQMKAMNAKLDALGKDGGSDDPKPEDDAGKPAMDEDAVVKAAEERFKAMDAFKTVNCEGDPKTMKVEEIKDAVIKHALDEDTSKAENVVRDAYFDIACKQLEPKAPIIPAMDAAPGGAGSDKAPRLSARDAHINNLNGTPATKED